MDALMGLKSVSSDEVAMILKVLDELGGSAQTDGGYLYIRIGHEDSEVKVIEIIDREIDRGGDLNEQTQS